MKAIHGGICTVFDSHTYITLAFDKYHSKTAIFA